MAADATVIRINGQFLELAHLFSWRDLDRFGMRLSEALEANLRRGLEIGAALSAAVRQTPTAFFEVNRIDMLEFESDLVRRISGLVTPALFVEHILRFKDFAERQLVHTLREKRDEESFRSAMQTHLNANFLTHREVPSGGGRSDILIVDPYRELIEAKVWHGEALFKDGIEELSRYLETEKLSRGFYVVIEFGEASRFLAERGTSHWSEVVDGREVNVIFVRIPGVAPSKAGSKSRTRSQSRMKS
jgi:hypothetical protein